MDKIPADIQALLDTPPPLYVVYNVFYGVVKGERTALRARCGTGNTLVECEAVIADHKVQMKQTFGGLLAPVHEKNWYAIWTVGGEWIKIGD